MGNEASYGMQLLRIFLLGVTSLAAERAVPTPRPPRGLVRTVKQLNSGTEQIPSKAEVSSVATSSRSLESEDKPERGEGDALDPRQLRARPFLCVYVQVSCEPRRASATLTVLG